MKLLLPRRLGLALVAAATALTTAVAVASPAAASPFQQLALPVQTTIAVDGTTARAIVYSTDPPLTDDGVSSDITLVLDDRGGWKFSGKVVNNNWLYRDMMTSCVVSDWQGNQILRADTSRYRVSRRDSKTWNWPRQVSPTIRDRFASFQFTSQAFCVFTVY